MKKLLISICVTTFFISNMQGQSKKTPYEMPTEKFRLKTNPLSLFIAYEPNFNLGLEHLFTAEKKLLGVQVSAGYIYNWNALPVSKNLRALDVSGFVLTGEFRVYDKGFFYGPYLQYKSINADYSRNISNVAGNPNFKSESAAKQTQSAGFIVGYFQKFGKHIGSEFYVGGGISKKVLYIDDEVVDNLNFGGEGVNLILENTGRLPQFMVTYKLSYNF